MLAIGLAWSRKGHYHFDNVVSGVSFVRDPHLWSQQHSAASRPTPPAEVSRFAAVSSEFFFPKQWRWMLVVTKKRESPIGFACNYSVSRTYYKKDKDQSIPDHRSRHLLLLAGFSTIVIQDQPDQLKFPDLLWWENLSMVLTAVRNNISRIRANLLWTRSRGMTNSQKSMCNPHYLTWWCFLPYMHCSASAPGHCSVWDWRVCLLSFLVYLLTRYL